MAELEDIRAQVEKRAEELQNKFGEPPPAGQEISEAFLSECKEANELGDGILYATMMQNDFTYNQASGEWLLWTGHHWRRDITNRALAAVERVALKFQELAKAAGKAYADASDDKEAAKAHMDRLKSIKARVSRLRSERGRVNCLKFATANEVKDLSITGEQLDCNPWLLAVDNGVVELKTGELRPGRQTDWLEKACPTRWEGIDAPAPEFEKFLQEIFNGNQELIDYVQRLFGYALTGLTVEHVLPILCGQGRNGKGTLVETISDVMGELAAPIQSEMLLDQGRNKSSAGPSPDIMALRGRRISFASENDEGRRFSPSRVKWLSGGDTLVGRAPHDKYETAFKPTHTLFLLTNHRPHPPMNDFAFWERVALIPFELSFVAREPEADNERPADKHLMAKLKKEASGILAWMVRGCIAWQQRGLDPPRAVKAATQDYKENEDSIGQFVSECCTEAPTAEVTAEDLYNAFSRWWTANISNNPLSQKKFGSIMAAKYTRIKKGTIRYLGIGLLA